MDTQLHQFIKVLEELAPPAYQESYDNSGLLTGSPNMLCTGVLLSLDCTETVVEEAIAKKCNLIVAHHPIVFGGLKQLTGANYVQRTIIKAIQNNIAIYACHTNLDNVFQGVNAKIGDKLGLQELRILAPKNGLLQKLVTFVPNSHHRAVLDALFASGSGCIGNYDSCSFNVEGTGTFRGNAQSKPFIGEPGKRSEEKEIRIEVLFETVHRHKVLRALREAHPYEEVAYDLYPLANAHPLVGSGMMGSFKDAIDEVDFLNLVKSTFHAGMLRHSALSGRKISKVAFCGGSGSFLLKDAIRAGADAYVTSDFKYHEFFDTEGKLLLIDTGHFESEQFTPEIFYECIQKNFPTFAIHLSKTNTNPINYF